jgi:hypothetical protein
VVVTGELALDFDNANDVLPMLRDAGGVFEDAAPALMDELNTLTSAPPESSVWSDEALRAHPVLARVRVVARHQLALPLLSTHAPHW